jgi:putative N6-adenine-specific DNA methylase
MLLTQTPSGKYRKSFGFQKWRDYDEKLFTEVKNAADKKISSSELSITGFELDMPNVELARINTAFLSPLVQVNIIKADMMKMKPPYSSGIIIVNPPYGERLRSQSVPELYAEMGTTFKHQYSGYRACVISSNFEALKNIGLKTSRRFTVFNGPLECKFQCFDLYPGTKKIHKTEEN